MKYSIAIVLALTTPLVAMAQTTIFNDTFNNGSTVQTASPITPTANSTTYDWFQQGGAPTTPTIASGDLHLAGRTTSSSIAEVQALFTTTPVTLATIGDYVDLTIVFVNTQNIFPAGSASTLNVGLFNAGGIAPVQGVRLDAAGSGTGGAVGWTGFVARMGGTGGSSPIYTRAPQGAGITNPNQSQDALFNGASGSSTYNNPTGVQISTTTPLFAAGLTAASTYTLDYRITLSAANTLTISNAIYSGSSVAGTALYSEIGVASGATYLTNSFDSLAFGWRFNSASAANSVDVGSIVVVDSIAPTPEPGTMAIFAGGIAMLALTRHSIRR